MYVGILVRIKKIHHLYLHEEAPVSLVPRQVMSQSVALPNVGWKKECLSYTFKDSLLKKKEKSHTG